jgi:hypothetical protein
MIESKIAHKQDGANEKYLGVKVLLKWTQNVTSCISRTGTPCLQKHIRISEEDADRRVLLKILLILNKVSKIS